MELGIDADKPMKNRPRTRRLSRRSFRSEGNGGEEREAAVVVKNTGNINVVAEADVPDAWGRRRKRVNKIKFSPKNERDMINVYHVAPRIEGNETPHAFNAVFQLELASRAE